MTTIIFFSCLLADGIGIFDFFAINEERPTEAERSLVPINLEQL
jgi:hypothetical protein